MRTVHTEAAVGVPCQLKSAAQRLLRPRGSTKGSAIYVFVEHHCRLNHVILHVGSPSEISRGSKQVWLQTSLSLRSQEGQPGTASLNTFFRCSDPFYCVWGLRS